MQITLVVYTWQVLHRTPVCKQTRPSSHEHFHVVRGMQPDALQGGHQIYGLASGHLAGNKKERSIILL